ncbi:Transcriptional regulator, BolA protein [Bibersteinia trehalosi USDA-ARS-USMARC-188]|uniref:Transcriptional regulator, BolA protein n=2 Tax=Bibersteinia trehalosi TaxID=47735 RepID=A0A4V7I8T9_BIBTR|nr:Transcriptional regulator, BolA protein [Bibersteinia trehalosi USDA-ARS-USMARC-188]
MPKIQGEIMSVEQTIVSKLHERFSPTVLHIENESHRHSAGRGAESHFKVVLVSDVFNAMRAVARHRAVYECLAQELENGVHALALHLYTLAEWEEDGEAIPASTNCVGHGK